MRIPPVLAEQCRQALADLDLPASHAVAQCAELGKDVITKQLTVMNKETRDQFVREVETRIAHIMAQRGALFAFELLRPLGVEALVEPTGDISVTFTKPIQPGAELTGQLPDETLHKPETAVRH